VNIFIPRDREKLRFLDASFCFSKLRYEMIIYDNYTIHTMISYQYFIVILSYHILCFNTHIWIHCMFACLFITYALLLISYAGGGFFLRYVSTNVYDIRIFYTENNKSISDLF